MISRPAGNTRMGRGAAARVGEWSNRGQIWSVLQVEGPARRGHIYNIIYVFIFMFIYIIRWRGRYDEGKGIYEFIFYNEKELDSPPRKASHIIHHASIYFVLCIYIYVCI